MSTPILPLAVWSSGTNQNSIPANDNALRLEILNGLVISKAVTAQPASPSEGDIYILAATHTGAQWAAFDPEDLVIYKGGTWYAFAPSQGVVVNFEASQEQFLGSTGWEPVSGGGGGSTAWADLTGVPSPITDLAALTDPGADRLLMWDDSAGAYVHATLGTNLSFTGTTLNAAGGGGAVAGSDKQIQYNNSGAFGAEAGFEYDQTTNTLTVPNATFSGLALTAASATGGAGLRLPHGAAPTSPTDGDVWSTTAGMYTRINGVTVGPLAAAGGGGLTNFTEAVNTSTPNASVPVVSLAPNNAATTVDIALIPKTVNGALMAAIPNNLGSGGNKRGQGAVDWQFFGRSSGSDVASGQASVVGGGTNNRATQTGAVVPGGGDNQATATYAFAMGSSCVASGTYSTAFGVGSTASGSGSGAFGSTASATGAMAFSFGNKTGAAGANALATGYRSYDRGIQGARVHCSYNDSNAVNDVATAQYGRYNLSGTSNNATPIVLTSSHNNTLATTNTLTVPTLSTFFVEGVVLARGGTPFDNVSWKITCQLTRDSGNVSIVGTPTIVQQFIVGASGWSIALSVNTTHQCLVITATGPGSISVVWLAVLQTVEVKRS